MDWIATLRGTNLNVPDAIQLAVAQSHRAAFFTNDRKIPSIPGLSMFVLEDLIGS
jgi:predicted nucleic acid-binding protein